MCQHFLMTVKKKTKCINNNQWHNIWRSKRFYLRHAQYASNNNSTLTGSLTSIWFGKNCSIKLVPKYINIIVLYNWDETTCLYRLYKNLKWVIGN